jgi:pyrroloquinoline quinone biosynthesis protein B
MVENVFFSLFVRGHLLLLIGKLSDFDLQRQKIGTALLFVSLIVWTPLEFTAGDEPVRTNDMPKPIALIAKPVELIVLGIAQDAGFPQAGCAKACCRAAWEDASLRRNVASIGLIDHETNQRWVFDCSPDFPEQLKILDQRMESKLAELKIAESKTVDSKTAKSKTGDSKINRGQSSPASPRENRVSLPAPNLDGIFLTHAHIGHYAGLIHLGREVMGAKKVPTYAMPRMANFLKTNGPWSQLVKLENISLRPIAAETKIELNDRISVVPFQVPHRDEFSETVGFKIMGPNKSVVFLPDIDKWSRWDQSIEKLIAQTDIAYLDGTFFENGEIPGRDMALIPHPFVAESIKRFAPLDETERKKVRFIHFNHTNPVLQPESDAARDIGRAGMAIAAQGEVVEL